MSTFRLKLTDTKFLLDNFDDNVGTYLYLSNVFDNFYAICSYLVGVAAATRRWNKRVITEVNNIGSLSGEDNN